jgi:hypothetical protein
MDFDFDECTIYLFKINYIGAEPQRNYRNNSLRFTDFQKSFLICESVAKKTKQSFEELNLERLKCL